MVQGERSCSGYKFNGLSHKIMWGICDKQAIKMFHCLWFSQLWSKCFIKDSPMAVPVHLVQEDLIESQEECQ